MARELVAETATLEAEVKSSYKGLLDTIDALEDSLPIRRGKPENPYRRKRRKKLPSLTNRKKSHADSSSRIEGTPWASPLVEETDRNSFPMRSFSLMDWELDADIRNGLLLMLGLQHKNLVKEQRPSGATIMAWYQDQEMWSTVDSVQRILYTEASWVAWLCRVKMS
ncbi:hypothetical protein IEQ34_014413 [Dendrobium chrysotoxum]|uniref:Uncharacterized protein n=1 Tax=Dendrobium chrysotoxum TaxID=161865 RepID=A0AAV7GJ81_DENCH|nr:hypothetical protein IEQ34_014413 [Dendrobium chrysotoxum]